MIIQECISALKQCENQINNHSFGNDFFNCMHIKCGGIYMCTAISFKTASHYFGRNLDMETSFGEEIVITPRNYPIYLKEEETMDTHYAMIGMAIVEHDFPLYYDATNEKGVSMAGLSFEKNAVYKDFDQKKANIAPHEFILWVLGQCAYINEVITLLENTHIIPVSFSEQMPFTPLHWMISDQDRSIVVECVEEGMKVYENPFGVLTNNPPFHVMCHEMNNYMSLTNEPVENKFKNLDLDAYSNGLGALGLPGDMSSVSRFVKAVFVKMHSFCKHNEEESVNQFFHILNSVEQIRGCVLTKEKEMERTIYSSCCNTDTQIYYYKTYEDFSIHKVELHKSDLNDHFLHIFPLMKNKMFLKNA